MRKALFAVALAILITFTGCLGQVDDPYEAPSGYESESVSSSTPVVSVAPAIESESVSEEESASLKISKSPVDYFMHFSQESVSFSLSVKGGSAPYTYTWFICHGKTKAQSFPQTSDKQFSKFTYNISDYDFDTYPEIGVICTVSDASGKTLDSNYARIYSHINILTDIKDYVLKEAAEQAEFTIEVYGGKPPYTYKWYKNNGFTDSFIQSKSDTATENTLRFNVAQNDLSENGTMQVWCSVTDSNGFSVSSSRVVITSAQ